MSPISFSPVRVLLHFPSNASKHMNHCFLSTLSTSYIVSSISLRVGFPQICHVQALAFLLISVSQLSHNLDLVQTLVTWTQQQNQLQILIKFNCDNTHKCLSQVVGRHRLLCTCSQAGGKQSWLVWWNLSVFWGKTQRLENHGQGKRPLPLTLVKVCPSWASSFLHIVICCDVLAPGLPTRRHYPFSVQTFYIKRRASFLFQDSKWGCQTRLL